MRIQGFRPAAAEALHYLTHVTAHRQDRPAIAVDDPGRLWSLWDMLHGLKRLVECWDEIEAERKKFSKLPNETRLEGGDRQTLKTKVSGWREAFGRAGFQHADRHAIKVGNDIHRFTHGDAVRELAELNAELMDDFGERYVYMVPKDRHDFYQTDFGTVVTRAFPQAVSEIKEGRSCYALGRHTACVFHLMRAAEHVLRIVVTAVGVTSPKVPLEYQQWHSLIEQLESRTKQIDSWRDPARANARAFFNRAIADFYAFKDDVRNVTMHTRSHGVYDGPGALSVMNQIRECFERIAEKANENTTNLMDASLFQ